MKQILFLLIASLLFSCSEKTKENIQDQNLKEDKISRNCKVSISIYGFPSLTQYYATFHEMDKYGDTLIVSKYYKTNGKEPGIKKYIYLNTNEQDSLYSYFQKIKTGFRLSEETTKISDGTKVLIRISSATNGLSYSYSGFDNAKNTYPDVTNLVKFINSKLPRDFQMN